MASTQPDLFAEDNAARKQLSEEEAAVIRERLLATLAYLAAQEKFPWSEPLDAVYEENRFERRSEMLGDEGAILWARFDIEMDRLYATRD